MTPLDDTKTSRTIYQFIDLCVETSIVSARDEGRGKEAVAALEREGLHPKFHQLDIDDVESIQRLGSFLSEKYGGLDLLVNNAAIAYKVFFIQ